jgi:hypothetical protein
MIRFLFALLITANVLNATAQLGPDKIIFGEFLVGASHNEGLAFGANLNCQSGLHLFTARYLTHRNFYNKLIAVYADNENLNVRSQQDEWALLYGPRLDFERFSASFSAGISGSVVSIVSSDVQANLNYHNRYIGIPYEFNVKFFKKKKSRYRLYGLVPVGKPTSFGRSIGMKLFGNFSGERYFGLGLTLGIGVHKLYSE